MINMLSGGRSLAPISRRRPNERAVVSEGRHLERREALIGSSLVCRMVKRRPGSVIAVSMAESLGGKVYSMQVSEARQAHRASLKC